ncbi:MAG: hypothetical protein WCS65_01615 [Verrucomicrobiae bacterium]
MNEAKLAELSGRYLAALRAHLEQGQQAGGDAPQDLGRMAGALGLETLDLAKVHDRALEALVLAGSLPGTRKNLARRGTAFFTEAIIPIEETHCRALETRAECERLNATLEQRTQELADSNRELQRQITGRKASEKALKKSASARLLKDSLALEKRLQHMVHKILSTEEDKRREMCLQLSEEIVQPLLGIKLRMLASKKEIAAHDETRTKEIAFIQRLVEDSAEIVNRIAHEFRD